MHDIAQMLMMAAGGAAGQVSLTLGGAEAANVAAASFTTAALSIGAAAADRLVVVAVVVDDVIDNGTPVVTAVTVGGSAAVELVCYSTLYQGAALWALAVPGGTTAAIGVTVNTGIEAYSVAVAAVYGAIETPAYTVASAPISGYGPITGVRNGLVLALAATTSSIYNSGVMTEGSNLSSGSPRYAAAHTATRLPTASGTVFPLNSGASGEPYVAASFAPK